MYLIRKYLKFAFQTLIGSGGTNLKVPWAVSKICRRCSTTVNGIINYKYPEINRKLFKKATPNIISAYYLMA